MADHLNEMAQWLALAILLACYAWIGRQRQSGFARLKAKLARFDQQMQALREVRLKKSHECLLTSSDAAQESPSRTHEQLLGNTVANTFKGFAQWTFDSVFLPVRSLVWRIRQGVTPGLILTTTVVFALIYSGFLIGGGCR